MPRQRWAGLFYATPPEMAGLFYATKKGKTLPKSGRLGGFVT
ncbi:hypothetical protein LTSESEN_3603 [Salmonella enterica subsp. enterica serovar Senftenberg str. A4-543]|uniref:Uncharacterized protein n=1 Tax=Salmonella enterica subsp. enterica serovar Senftenberg str. A4-543 TaxID=913082 RepID=G5R2I6_SALSE|nr:hypothetical protein LTSESEN_3603 [Salmonella enterica subsp. enterica serovar Senftenberg str. A4-543]